MKKLLIPVLLVAVLAAAYLLGTGLRRESAAFITDYTVSPDGTQITLHVSVSSSAGYIRKVVPAQQHGGKLYLDCYAAFGGFNGSWGAKSSCTVPLDPDTKTIALYRAPNCYEVVLEKDISGQWQRAK